MGVRCAGDVGLARYHSKVNRGCDSASSGTETPQKPSKSLYTTFMDLGDFSNS